MDCIYCTPEWLEESARIYRSNPVLMESLKRLTSSVYFRVTAEPEWGIDEDFVFGGTLTKGTLDELRFYTKDEVNEKAQLILAATPQEWKLLLRKVHKFITDVMLGKVKIEKGTITAVLAVAPYADGFIDALTQVNLIFQDELTPDQLNEYRANAAQFRPKLGI